MIRTDRSAFGAALAAGILLALTACAVPAPSPRETIPHDADSGQTITEAREAIDAVPGISVTDFAGGGPPNVKGNTGYAVALAIDPGYTVLHGDVLVDYVVRNVWSVGEGYMPNTQIQISATTADGEPFFDLSTAGVGSAWMGGQPSVPSQHNTIIIPLSADDPEGARNLSLLTKDGSWPGVTPKPLPDRVTVKDH